MEEGRQDLESVAPPDPRSWDEGETQELPRQRGGTDNSPRTVDRWGFGPGLRRTAVAIAVTAAALVGFACALLLPGRHGDDAARAASPSASAERPTATVSAPADPDGTGTLREGDSGPAVTDLQERLLHIPDVYADGSTNGAYDATLKAAVARFQLWYGIRGDETGVYGNDTR